ncbi:hypothetical protein AHAS_Ahas17G0132700 [Arachis hypogaea]
MTKIFENELVERKVYVFSNFEIEESSGIYLSTAHTCKISFKKETCIVHTIYDHKIPYNYFSFLAMVIY